MAAREQLQGTQVSDAHPLGQLRVGKRLGPSGRRAHCLDFGPRAAPAILLLHGLGGLAQEVSAPLTGALVAAGLRVIAIDRPGYGLSDPAPAEAMGPAAQARWLADVIERLDARVAVILGHSFGAAVALRLGLERPILGLVLVNPFCRPTPPAPAPLMRLAVAPAVGAFVRRKLAPALAEPLVRWSLAHAFAPDAVPSTLRTLPARVIAQESAVLAMAAELRAFNADVARLPDCAAKLSAPVIALTGAADRVIEGAAHGDWLSQTFSQVEHRCAPGGHALHHTHPQLVTDAILRLAA